MSESFHSVVIVGAGAAGLYAAQLLRARFPDVLVVEAQDHVGGRIKQVRCASEWHPLTTSQLTLAAAGQNGCHFLPPNNREAIMLGHSCLFRKE